MGLCFPSALIFRLDPLLCLSLALLLCQAFLVWAFFPISLSFPSSLFPLSSKYLSFRIYGSFGLSLPPVSPCLPISPQPHLPVSAGPGGSGWVLDSLARAPRRTMPHSRGPSAPWQRARPALPARAARAKRMPWLRQARARPARRRPARSRRGRASRGRPAAASAWSWEGLSLHPAFRDSVPQFPVL